MFPELDLCKTTIQILHKPFTAVAEELQKITYWLHLCAGASGTKLRAGCGSYLVKAALWAARLFFFGGGGETPPKHAAEPPDCPRRHRAAHRVGIRHTVRPGMGLVLWSRSMWKIEIGDTRPVQDAPARSGSLICPNCTIFLPLLTMTENNGRKTKTHKNKTKQN